jgi:hypothetical protein
MYGRGDGFSRRPRPQDAGWDGGPPFPAGQHRLRGLLIAAKEQHVDIDMLA